jgi:putative transposase
MNAIFFILRTGAQWKSLKLYGVVSGSTAHRWFQFWLRTGVFHQLWKMLLEEYDDDIGIDWDWLSMDGSMVKAPLGGEGTGPNPTDRGKKGHQAKHIDRRKWYSLGARSRRSKHPRYEAG